MPHSTTDFRTATARMLFAVTIAVAMQIQAQEWFPYTEAEGRVSTDRNVVRGNIFAPVWQSEDSFFFFDIRGLTTSEDANEGNLGFGYRKLVGPDRLVGVFGYYDFRETEFGNQYHQGSLGTEMLSSKWGFRLNGYLPEGDAQAVSQFNTAFLSGNNVFMRQGLEAAYWGADIEMERLLWTNTDNGKGGKAPLKVAEFDAEWWASVGYFHFDQSDSRFESISGPRLRTELRLWNLPLLGNDSRVMLTGQYEYDDVRGSIGTAGLAVRIPIGRYESAAAPLSGIRRRMLESVVRDIDIVTNAGAFGDPERAKFARTGELINGTVSVDGATPDPEAVIEGAGDNSLVLASGGAGTIFPAGTVDMNRGQVILGGGSVIGVVGCGTGAHANFLAPGTRPTFRSGMNDGFTAATNGAIIGTNFGSSFDGTEGILLRGVTNFLLDDVTISMMGGDGILGINSSFLVVDSMINTTGNLADGIESTDSFYAVRNSTINASDDGIDIVGSTVTITDSTITAEADALDTRNSVVSISGSKITTNARSANASLVEDSNSRFSIHNSTLSINGVQTSEAFLLNQTQSFALTDSTVTINNSPTDGFSITDVPGFTIANSTITQRGVIERVLDFDLSVNSMVNFNNVTVFAGEAQTNSSGSAVDLDTTGSAVVNFTVSDSTFTGVNLGNGVFGRIITSSDSSNLTFNLLRSTVRGIETVGGENTDGIEDFESLNNSSLTVNIIDSTITSGRNDGIEDLRSQDDSTFRANIIRSTIEGSTSNLESDAGIEGVEAFGNSTMNVVITDSNISGGGTSSEGISEILVRDNAMTTAVFTRSSFIGRPNNTIANASGEGIEDVETSESGSLDLTIVDSTISGSTFDQTSGVMSGPAFQRIDATGVSTLRFAISGTTLTTGANAFAVQTRAFDAATVTGSFTNNIFTATNVAMLTTAESGASTVNLQATGNTLTSGAAFNDFEFIPNTGTINVVDFLNLSPNNNGASIGTSGPINDILVLP